MAPSSKFSMLNRGATSPGDNNETLAWRHEGFVPRREPITMSKAERLLGVSDTGGMYKQRGGFDSGKRSQKKGFGAAFSELKGALTGASRYNGSRGRRTPTSPGFRTTTDSDSITSAASPTFDTADSTSTLPSNYDPPKSPYYSNRGTPSPSDGDRRQLDARHDYHAALSPLRHRTPYESDMPSIVEDYDDVEEPIPSLPPLEKPPLSPTKPPSTPKSRSSFYAVNILRSPSSTSVASESTATKSKWLSWRSNKATGKEYISDYASVRSAEQVYTSAMAPPELPLPRSKPDIENWLARADLERSPSVSESTTTRSTIPRFVHLTPMSPTGSSMSAKTMATQRELTAVPRYPRASRGGIPLRSIRSDEDLITPSRERRRSARIQRTDLLIESVLSLSSSEEEDGAESVAKPKRHKKRISVVSTDTYATRMQRTLSLSSSNSPPQSLTVPGQRVSRSINQTIAPQKSALVNSSSKTPFSSVHWQLNDQSEAGAICMAAAEKGYPAGMGVQEISLDMGRRPRNARPLSMVSPTSKVMVVSQKEEKLLAAMREKQANPDRASVAGSDISGSTYSQTPIISISPPRRSKKDGTLVAVDEVVVGDQGGEVITFPAPPTRPGSHDGTSSSLLSLNLSTSASSNRFNLPEVVRVSESEGPSSISILAPSTASRSLTSLTISELAPTTSMMSEGRYEFEAPRSPQELYGSVPDLAATLRSDINRQRAKPKSRVSTDMMYITGLEGTGYGEDEDFEDMKDLAKFVMSSCI